MVRVRDVATMEASVERRLILVRHSVPEVVADVPAREWRLSEKGRERAAALAERLGERAKPAAIVSSVEPKAAETAAILARAFGVHCETAEGLHEHDRSNVGWLSSERFDLAITDFFRRPQELVLGRETAAEAQARVERAIAEALRRHPCGDMVVVTHGTVMTLLVAATNTIDMMAFWRRLKMPDYAVLRLPERTLGPVTNEQAGTATAR